MPILTGCDARDHTCVDMPYGILAKSTSTGAGRVLYRNGIAEVDAETAATVQKAAQALCGEGLRVEERTPPESSRVTIWR